MTKRRFDSDRLVLATHNKGKIAEIGQLLSPYDVACASAGDLDLPEPEETGQSFSDNAILKAKAACEASGLVALADDSGLSVKALGGDPGIFSARWAGPDKDFMMAMKKVHDALGDAVDRAAAFICVIALAWPDGHVETFEGRVDGQIVWPPRGDKGFGYDPCFIPEGHDRTFAEMNIEEKQLLSHRARALKMMLSDCFI